jgi:hypothetical protein
MNALMCGGFHAWERRSRLPPVGSASHLGVGDARALDVRHDHPELLDGGLQGGYALL